MDQVKKAKHTICFITEDGDVCAEVDKIINLPMDHFRQLCHQLDVAVINGVWHRETDLHFKMGTNVITVCRNMPPVVMYDDGPTTEIEFKTKTTPDDVIGEIVKQFEQLENNHAVYKEPRRDQKFHIAIVEPSADHEPNVLWCVDPWKLGIDKNYLNAISAVGEDELFLVHFCDIELTMCQLVVPIESGRIYVNTDMNNIRNITLQRLISQFGLMINDVYLGDETLRDVTALGVAAVRLIFGKEHINSSLPSVDINVPGTIVSTSPLNGAHMICCSGKVKNCGEAQELTIGAIEQLKI